MISCTLSKTKNLASLIIETDRIIADAVFSFTFAVLYGGFVYCSAEISGERSRTIYSYFERSREILQN